MRDRLVEGLVEAIRVAETRLPLDVYEALVEAAGREESERARANLEALIRNAEAAAREGKPICQDTGLLTFYVEIGWGFPLTPREVAEAIVEATRRATREVPLRPNAVDPLRGSNSGDNTGRHVPIIHWEPREGEELRVHVVPKGGGSEYPSKLYVIPPAEGIMGAARRVLEAVIEAGAKPCPPVIVGVGIGGTVEEAVSMAKRCACLRRVGEHHSEPTVRVLEEALLEAINALGIGPMGLGGRTTALWVAVDYAHRHPANYPVAVAFNCWAARRATVAFDATGEWRITSRHVGG